MFSPCDRIYAALDGEPSEALLQHLQACPDCEERQAHWLTLRALLPGAMEPDLSDGFAASTAEGIAKAVHVERARPVTAGWGDVARLLWGGLAWGLIGATWAGLEASRTLSQYEANAQSYALTAVAWAQVHSLAHTSPEWLSGWPLGSLLMLLTGLWMLRPWSFWRTVRTGEPVPLRRVLAFGLRTLILGLGVSLPACTQVLAQPERDMAGAVCMALSAWSLLCLGLTGILAVLKCPRTLAMAAWFLAASLLVSMTVEPWLTSALVSTVMPGPGDSRDSSQVEQLAEAREMALHGAPNVPSQAFGTRLALFENTFPGWGVSRAFRALTIFSPGEYWWGLVTFAGGLGLISGLLLAGPSGRRLGQVAFAIGLSGVALPWGLWLHQTVDYSGLFDASLAVQAAQQPHPEEARTVVALTAESNGQLKVFGYPLPGLLDAMLHSPRLASPTTPNDVILRYSLEGTRAALCWDHPAWFEAEIHLSSAESGLEWDIAWTVRQMERIDWDHCHPNRDAMHLVEAGGLSAIEPQDRADAKRLIGHRLLCEFDKPPVMLPPVTVQGVVYLNGRPAANLPVRLCHVWDSATEIPDFCYQEVHNAIRQCFEEWPGSTVVPVVTRTDRSGHFVFHNPRAGRYFPAVMLPGHWHHATTKDPPRPQMFQVDRSDVNLGRFNVEVTS